MSGLTEAPPRPATQKARSPLEHELGPHYRSLIYRLRGGSSLPAGLRTIGITSCSGGEGVTSVAMNLAVVAAEAQLGRVLLVDANVENPSLPRHFLQCRQKGVTDLLAGDAECDACIWESPVENLFLLAAGSGAAAPVPRCDADVLGRIVDRLKESFGLTIFDLPPAHELSACFPLASQLDGVLLVVEAERVRSAAALRARQQLEDAQVPLLGVVFNKRRRYLPNWLYRLL